MSIFEIIMLVCFGAAWPLSILRSWRSQSNRGKSLLFMLIVLAGYIAGILHKIYYNYDLVIILYCINSIMIMIDLLLYWRNHRLEQAT